MSSTSRRQFLKKTALTAGAVSAAPAVHRGFASGSPNDRVNVAVVGFHDRGRAHYKAYAPMKNVRVAALCDVDERLFPAAVKYVEGKSGTRPETVFDFRRLLDNKGLQARPRHQGCRDA